MVDRNLDNQYQAEAPPKAQAVKQVTAREFYTVLFVHKWTISISFIVMLAAIFWGLSLRERQYIASVKFYVNRSLQQQASLRYIGSRDWEEHINSISEIGRSQGVLLSAATDYDAARGWVNPPVWRTQAIAVGLESMVEVTPVPATAIINILIKDVDADTALMVAGIYGKAFSEEVLNISRQSESRVFFEKAIRDVEDKIANANAQKAAVQQEAQLNNWEHEQNALTESIQILTRELTERQVDREVLEQQVTFERKALDSGEKSFLTSILRDDDFMKQLKYKLGELRLELSALEARFTPGHRSRISKEREIFAAEAQLLTLLEESVAEHEQRLMELIGSEAIVASTIDSMKARQREIPEIAAKISSYDSFIKAQWRLYNELITKLNDMLVSDDRTLVSHKVVQLGTPIIGGVVGETQKAVYMIIAPIFALMLAVSIAFMVEAADHTFQKSADLEEYCGLPVLAIFRKI